MLRASVNDVIIFLPLEPLHFLGLRVHLKSGDLRKLTHSWLQESKPPRAMSHLGASDNIQNMQSCTGQSDLTPSVVAMYDTRNLNLTITIQKRLLHGPPL